MTLKEFLLITAWIAGTLLWCCLAAAELLLLWALTVGVAAWLVLEILE